MEPLWLREGPTPIMTTIEHRMGRMAALFGPKIGKRK